MNKTNIQRSFSPAQTVQHDLRDVSLLYRFSSRVDTLLQDTKVSVHVD